jgi:hypothetical protein
LRVLLRPKIVFKNTEIAYQSELRFLGINMTGNMKWCAHARFLKAKLCKVVHMVKTLKETMSPIHDKNNLFFKFFVIVVYYGVGIRKVKIV